MMFNRLAAYADYRDTTSPWLTRVPSHWNMVRMKSVLNERVEKGYPNEPLLAATQSHGVIRKSDYATRTVTATKDLHLLKLVEVGDFVISLRSFQGGIERCYHRGIISPAYTVLTAKSEPYRDYLTFLFKSKPFVNSLSLAVTGIREGQNIDYSRLAVDLLPVPPIEEQAWIARYLTHADARIQRAMANKRALLTLLREQFSVQLEGELGGWRTARLARVATVRRRTGASNLPLLSVYLGRGVVPYDEGGYRVHKPSVSLDAYQEVRPGDWVLNNQQAWRGSVGVSSLNGLVSPAYIVLEVDSSVLDARYCRWLLSSRRFADAMTIASRGVGTIQRDVHMPSLRASQVPLPPLDEQCRIAERLTEMEREINLLTGRLQQELVLLAEFRARLVADVVTGQIDVRKLAAELAEVEVSAMNDAARQPSDISSLVEDEVVSEV